VAGGAEGRAAVEVCVSLQVASVCVRACVCTRVPVHACVYLCVCKECDA